MGKLKLTVYEEQTRPCKVPEEIFDLLGFTFGRRYSATTVKPNVPCGHQSKASGAWSKRSMR